jgi:acylphosphatase
VLQAFTVIATGNVQGVQFRRSVRDLARGSGLVGSVENLPDGTVRIVVQGDDSKIDTFLGTIRMLPDPIRVDDLPKSSIAINSELKIFEVIYGDVGQELEESMSAGLGQLTTLTSEIREFRTNTAQDFRLLNSKYDSISNTPAKVVQQSAETSNELKRSMDSLLKSLDGLSLLAKAYFEERLKDTEKSSSVKSDNERPS